MNAMLRTLGVSILASTMLVSSSSPSFAQRQQPQAPAGLQCLTCVEEQVTVKPSGGSFVGEQVVRVAGGSAQPLGGTRSGGGCGDCTYTVIPTCDFLLFGGPCVPGDACAADEVNHLVFRSEPGDSSRAVSNVCLSPDNQPVPVQAITDAVRAHLSDELIPEDVEVALTPGTTALITAPTLFRAVRATAVTEEFFTAGFPVTVTATPARFGWDFGDGNSITTDTAGALYTPGADITEERFVVHRYDQPGEHTVRLSVQWAGSYVLPGVGTVDAGTITRSAEPVILRVVQARTRLVDR